MSLAVIQTHPIQYYAPIYAMLQKQFGIEVWGIFASDFSVRGGYRDKDFDRTIRWTVDMESGYQQIYLSHKPINRISASGLDAAIDRLKPSVIMITGYQPWPFYIPAFICAHRRKIPIIFRADATDVAVTRSHLKILIRRAALNILYKPVDYFLYGGVNAKNHYLNLGIPANKLIFSPMSVPSRTINNAGAAGSIKREVTRRRLGIPDHVIMLLFSGKLTRKKSPDHLILASKLLPAVLKNNIAIVIMGDGVMRDALENMAADKHGLHSIQCVGFKNQDVIDDYYDAADALVLCSLFGETWGLVVNEALMRGKPCVLSDKVGCGNDLIIEGGTGYIYPAGDIRALGCALEKVVDLAKTPGTGERCRNHVAKYSTEISASGIVEAYNRLI
jgi:glycosyltransferase involved in cell wall biosynthesis